MFHKAFLERLEWVRDLLVYHRHVSDGRNTPIDLTQPGLFLELVDDLADYPARQARLRCIVERLQDIKEVQAEEVTHAQLRASGNAEHVFLDDSTTPSGVDVFEQLHRVDTLHYNVGGGGRHGDNPESLLERGEHLLVLRKVGS
ncbi:hypothetical protein D3C71_1566040 [compost metagenome]